MQTRPIPPKAGQESVWDYPRPPRLEADNRRIRVIFNGVTLTDSTRAMRVLETSHPPTFYIPPADIAMAHLSISPRRSYCEWKGGATYYTITAGNRKAIDAAWAYLEPTPAFQTMAGYVAFYPSRMDACYVGEELVQAQAGDFYGGWITSEIVGPFKGEPGTWGW